MRFIKVLKFALQNFVRNAWLSLITLTIIVITLLAVNVIISVNHIKEATLISIENFVTVTFALDKDVTEQEVASFVTELDSYSEVEAIQIHSPEENLETFKGNFPNLAEVTDALDENPLTFTLTVETFEVDQYNTVIDKVNGSDYQSLVESTTLEDFRLFIEQTQAFIDRFNLFTVGFTAFFAIIGLIVIFNTIRVSIYTHREEVGIMKLVGATNWFVRLPFLLEALLYSLVAVVVTFLLIYPALQWSAPWFIQTFDGIDVNLIGYYNDNFWALAGLQFIGISFISLIATSFALRKYLRV